MRSELLTVMHEWNDVGVNVSELLTVTCMNDQWTAWVVLAQSRRQKGAGARHACAGARTSVEASRSLCRAAASPWAAPPADQREHRRWLSKALEKLIS